VNYSGQLGLGDNGNRGDEPGEMGDNLPKVDLGTGRRASMIDVGNSSTCAVLDDGSVKCWGSNNVGRLGLGNTEDRGDDPYEMGDNLPAVDLGSGLTAVSVAVGDGHACALLAGGSIKCWGNGLFGADGRVRWGDEPGEMGDNLPFVDLGPGVIAKRISAGDMHTCALLENDTLKCWGSNGAGELGLGDGEIRGDEPTDMGDNLPVVDLGGNRTPIDLTTGAQQTCVVFSNDSVACWGWNPYGQLGLGHTETRGDDPGEMGNNLELVDVGEREFFQQINGGAVHTCLLLDFGQVKCWGYNDGRLGLGETEARGDEPVDMSNNLPDVDLGGVGYAIQVSAGFGHTCALLGDRSIKCWGLDLDGTSGTLGLADPETLGDEPGEMGDNLPAVDIVF
jgi:alpha-tubulin suppressor-like RCC1 family protein